MGLSLSAEQKSIIKIFKIEEQYIIPAYQRPYSWGYDECLTLYNDMVKAFIAKEEYFIGNIFISRSENNKDILEVIDGQQRLTTILLLIKVFSMVDSSFKPLKDILTKENWETGKPEARIISNVFETEDGKELAMVLAFDENKFEKLEKLCSDNKGKFSENRCKKEYNNKFIKNIMHLYGWVTSYNRKNDDLREFITFFLKNVYLLPVEFNGKTADEAQEKALKIFETMNNRGLSLDDSDIFKAKLYEKADRVGEIERFKKAWKELKNACELLDIGIIDLFKYYSHIIRGKNNKTTSEINLREFFTVQEYSPFNLKNYDEILDDLFIIREVLEYIATQTKQQTVLAKWLQLIDRYSNQYPKNLLVVYIFISLEKDNQINEELLIKFLTKVIRYTYYQGATTRIKFDIYNMIKDVSNGREIDSYIQKEVSISYFDYLGALKYGYALLAFYLEEEKALVSYDVTKIVTYKDWEFLEDKWQERELEEFENSLGNFVVLDIAQKNMSIDKKRAYYETSKLSTVQEIREMLKEYKFEDFKQRDKKLRDILIDFFEGRK